jgi:hypothetical protein
MAMLIPPQVPEIKSVGAGSWNLLTHADFDGSVEDCFSGTSMHLSFSGYNLPLHTGIHGSQDVDAYLLESIIQVRDKGKWVADIDILNVVDSNIGRVDRHPFDLACNHESLYRSEMGLTFIDTWDELLEGPESTAIARAHGNWLSRLALTCVAAHKGYDVYILPPSFCWKCAIYLANSSNRALAIKNLREVREASKTPAAPDPQISPAQRNTLASRSESVRSGSRRGYEKDADDSVGKGGTQSRLSALGQYLRSASGGKIDAENISRSSTSSRQQISLNEGSPPPLEIAMEFNHSQEIEVVSKDRLVLVL